VIKSYGNLLRKFPKSRDIKPQKTKKIQNSWRQVVLVLQRIYCQKEGGKKKIKIHFEML
jgi:hypothetical protein